MFLLHGKGNHSFALSCMYTVLNKSIYFVKRTSMQYTCDEIHIDYNKAVFIELFHKFEVHMTIEVQLTIIDVDNFRTMACIGFAL